MVRLVVCKRVDGDRVRRTAQFLQLHFAARNAAKVDIRVDMWIGEQQLHPKGA